MPNFDDFKLVIEAMSGGKNTVLFDDVGMPSVVVPFPKVKISELIESGTQNAHPAFFVNSAEKAVMYVSKFQNVVLNERAYSLPMRDPRTSVNFDQAVQFSRNKGKGWGLMPYSLWCAIALWCKKNNTMPRGNNQWGKDITYTHEKGVPAAYETADNGHKGDVIRTLTGSGPASWYHNWMPDGISDMNGNVWEWTAGLRMKAGELQIIPYSNCMDQSVSLAAASDAWKAIDSKGNLVEPGSGDTLKWDWVANKLQLTNAEVKYTTNQGNGHSYKEMTKADGLEEVPELAKILLLYPDDPSGDYGGDWHYANLTDERLSICGGHWSYGASAGVFYVSLDYLRSNAGGGIGFRSAYCDL